MLDITNEKSICCFFFCLYLSIHPPIHLSNLCICNFLYVWLCIYYSIHLSTVSVCVICLSSSLIFRIRSLVCATALTRAHIFMFLLFRFWGFPFGQALDCSYRKICGCYLQMQQRTSKIDSQFANYQCSYVNFVCIYSTPAV